MPTFFYFGTFRPNVLCHFTKVSNFICHIRAKTSAKKGWVLLNRVERRRAEGGERRKTRVFRIRGLQNSYFCHVWGMIFCQQERLGASVWAKKIIPPVANITFCLEFFSLIWSALPPMSMRRRRSWRIDHINGHILYTTKPLLLLLLCHSRESTLSQREAMECWTSLDAALH